MKYWNERKMADMREKIVKMEEKKNKICGKYWRKKFGNDGEENERKKI
ncbi:MAG: hypothetical protein ABIH83_03950 [Candidatus Micrarchaeota archaeon]